MSGVLVSMWLPVFILGFYVGKRGWKMHDYLLVLIYVLACFVVTQVTR